MKSLNFQVLLCFVSIFISTVAFCEETEKDEGPWEKYAINLGAFISSADSTVRFGPGVGLTLDLGRILDFDSSNRVFRVDGSWRFTKNRNHRLDFSWHSFNYSGTKTAEIDIGDDITTGQTLDGYLEIDIYQIRYGYSFIQDDRLDLAATAGLYIMPIKFGLKADGVFVEDGNVKFTAPLPLFGLRMDVAVAPKWYIRTGTQFFYLEYEQFTGSITSLRGAVEYQPWKNFGLGLGFDSFNLEVEADGEDFPEIDFRGYMQFKYVGLQLYARFFF